MVLTMTLIASVFLIYSCADEIEGTTAGHNFSMDFETRAGETSATDLIPNMRLITFTENARMFHGEVLNITRTANKLTAKVETGKWHMAMISSPENFTLVSPNTTVAMDDLPMYIYNPTTTNGKTESAPELFFQNKLTPQIVANTKAEMDAQLNRAVAKVELVIRKATPNFNLNGDHKIELHDVPSTLSYTGKLLPSKENPTTLSESLKSPVTLKSSTAYPGFLEAETITFIIPAHQGTDFTAANPTDVISEKMSITVDLERAGGGSRFKKTEVIDKVALCNRVLRVIIEVNDGVKFETEVLPWERVDVSANVGAGYQNWLYVKKDATGNGLSWSDPLPNITTAITKANALIGVGKIVNGILVAGGTDSNMLYSESFTIPQNIKIYGGWKGTDGTELAAANVTGPYTSTDRDLKTYKARVATGTGNIVLSNAGAVLDGFVVSGSGSGSVAGLVTVSNASASINAVEINQQTVSSTHALSISAGTGTNVLVSKNSKGVSVTSSGKLVNATVVGNNGASAFTGTLLNSVYWGNSAAANTTGGTIDYCAFQGTTPAGTNYPLSDTNTLWFTSSNIVPGPHFDLGVTSGLADYEIGSAKPNRSPMLRRGDKSSFDNSLPVTIDDQYKKDINGNIRHHIAIDNVTQVVDIGCYEDGSHPGFQLKWATKDVYVSAKKGYFSQLPLLLPANEDPDINIEVRWTVTVVGGSLTQCSFDGSVIDDEPTGSNTGVGTGVMVGMVQFTPTVEYTSNSERPLGTISISTQLGAYLPNTTVDVRQTKGQRTEWKTGYVGSFHRDRERGARFIHAYNTGKWTARIFKGLDWIKIDDNDKNYGEDIKDSQEGTTPSGGYYKDVVETWGGVLEGDGYIKFRVGMKSKNTTGKPRYGLIIITRTGGVSYFFVRQGEDDDYLYRAEDTPKPTAGTRAAANIVKFSPYNLIDPQEDTSGSGRNLGKNGGWFTKYPSQIGYYFKWNSTQGFLMGSASNTSTGTTASSWSDSREVCPQYYRHPTYLEYCNSIYWNVANDTYVSPSGTYVTDNREWGAYADGWYDQLVTSPLSSSATAPLLEVGSGIGRAQKGVLMVSHYNYASIFFPAGGTMTSDGSYTVNSLNTFEYALYPTTYSKDVNTHWYNSHIGMSCTKINTYASPVRCVYVGP